MGTSNDSARKRLGLILEDILARLRAEPNLLCLGPIVNRTLEAAELARQLGYARPPLVLEERVVSWIDATGDTAGDAARLPGGDLAGKSAKGDIIRALESWCRELALGEHGESPQGEPTPKSKALLPCYQRAREAFLWAIRECADLSDDDNDEAALQKIHNAIRAGGCPAYPSGTKVPAFDTWATYLRKAREKVNSPRTAREHGQSIVNADEI